MKKPHALPAGADLIDAAAAQRILATSPAEGDATPYAVLEVRFDSTGAVDHPRVLESNLPRSAQSAMANAVIERAPMPAEEQPWGVLLRVEGVADSPPILQVGRMELCACALMNRSEVTDLLVREVAQVQNPSLAGRRMLVILDIRSDSAGNVVESRIHRPSESFEVNRVVEELIPHMRIAPALLNRHRTKLWSRLPITVNFQQPRARSSGHAKR